MHASEKLLPLQSNHKVKIASENKNDGF